MRSHSTEANMPPNKSVKRTRSSQRRGSLLGWRAAYAPTFGCTAMRKYFGRLYEALVRGMSQHLLDFGRIVGLDNDQLAQLSQQKEDDAREHLFLSFIEGRHGGPVDWKGSADDVYEVLLPCLSEEEKVKLPEWLISRLLRLPES